MPRSATLSVFVLCALCCSLCSAACGPPCNADQWCSSASQCLSKGKVGSTCETIGSCVGALICHSRKCASLRKVGESCGAAQPACSAGFCDALNTPAAPTCKNARTIARGGKCSAQVWCKGDSYCASGTCAARQALGAACASDNECAGACSDRECDNYCASGTKKCTARLPIGSACSKDLQCQAFGRCNSKPCVERFCFGGIAAGDTAKMCRDRSEPEGPCEDKEHCLHDESASTAAACKGTAGAPGKCTEEERPKPEKVPPPPPCKPNKAAGQTCGKVCECTGAGDLKPTCGKGGGYIDRFIGGEVDCSAKKFSYTRKDIAPYVFCALPTGKAARVCSAQLSLGRLGCRRGYSGGSEPGSYETVYPPQAPNRHCISGMCLEPGSNTDNRAAKSGDFFGGLCVAIKKIGEACDAPPGVADVTGYPGLTYHTQCPGGYCSAGKCTAAKPAATACDEDYECGYDLNKNHLSKTPQNACNRKTKDQPGVCMKPCSQDGNVNTPGTNIPASSPACPKGFYCEGDAAARPRSTMATFSPPYSADYGTFVADKRRHYYLHSTLGFCRSLAAIGEPCGGLSGPYCANFMDYESFKTKPAAFAACIVQSGGSAVCTTVKAAGQNCTGGPRPSVAGEGTWKTSGPVATASGFMAIGTYQIQCPKGYCSKSGTCTDAATCESDYQCGAYELCVGASAGKSDGKCIRKCKWWSHTMHGFKVQCNKGEYCIDPTKAKSHCEPKRQIGETCPRDDACVSQAYCSNNKCKLRLKAGEKCKRSGECAGNSKLLDRAGQNHGICATKSFSFVAKEEGDPADTIEISDASDKSEALCVTTCKTHTGLGDDASQDVRCSLLQSLEKPVGKAIALLWVLICLILPCRVYGALCGGHAKHAKAIRHGHAVGMYMFVGALSKDRKISEGSHFQAPPPKPCFGPHAPKGDRWEKAHADVEPMLAGGLIDTVVNESAKRGCGPCAQPDIKSVKGGLAAKWLPEVNAALDAHLLVADVKFDGKVLALHVFEKNGTKGMPAP